MASVVSNISVPMCHPTLWYPGNFFQILFINVMCRRDEGKAQRTAHRERSLRSLVILRCWSEKSAASKKAPILAINPTHKYFDCFRPVFKPTQWALENNPLIQKEKYNQLISGSYSVFQMRCFSVLLLKQVQLFIGPGCVIYIRAYIQQR